MIVKKDIFYNTDSLSFKQREKLVYECINLSDRNIVEKLNCRISWCRQSCKLNVDEFMKKFDESCFLSIKQNYDILEQKYYFYICIRTMTSPNDYFLWINLFNDRYKILLEYLKRKYGVIKKE